MYYGITYGGGDADGGFRSEAEAVRTALEMGEPEAVIWYGYEELGRADVLAEELGILL